MDYSVETGNEFSEIIANWIEKFDEDKVTDPACGKADILSELEERNPGIELTGLEISSDTANVARERLYNAEIEIVDFFDFEGEFDSLVLDPPVNSNFRDTKKLNIDERPRWGLHQYFAIEALQKLREDGSFALLLPTQSLKGEFFNEIIDLSEIYRTISVPNGKFDSMDYTLVLGKKEQTKENSITIISVENTKDLEESLNYKGKESLDSTEGLQFAELKSDQLTDYKVNKILSFPRFVQLYNSKDLTNLSTYFDLENGIKTRANNLFYLETEEQRKIDDKLQKPLIKGRTEGFSLRDEDLEKSFLDISSYGEKIDKNLIDNLKEKGFNNAVNYLEKHQHKIQDSIKTISADNNPGLVKPKIDHQKFYKADISGSTFLDTNYIGLESDYNSKYVDIIWKYLNTDIHRKIDRNLQNGSTVRRVTLTALEKYQVPKKKVLDRIRPKIEDLGLDDKHQIKTIEERILEELSEETRELLREFEERDQRLKWAWLLSDEKFEEFRRKYRKDKEAARDLLAREINSEAAKGIDKNLEISQINRDRKRVLEGCLEEFKDKNYEKFLLIAITQFEGLILDIALKRGWEIEGDEIQKNGITHSIQLSELTEHFIEDDFSEFILEEIRPWRNDLAHGRMKKDERAAKVTFGSIAAIIQEYDSYINSEKT